MRGTTKRAWLKWMLTALCALWIVFIWHFSLADGIASGETSNALRDETYKVLERIDTQIENKEKEKEKEQGGQQSTPQSQDGTAAEPAKEEETPPDPATLKGARLKIYQITQFLKLYFRKLAHFFEFFILGGLVCFVLYAHGAPFGWLWALPVPFFVGGVDELLQHFTPGRDGKFEDVLLDFGGGAAGVAAAALLLLAVVAIVRHAKRKKMQKNT